MRPRPRPSGSAPRCRRSGRGEEEEGEAGTGPRRGARAPSPATAAASPAHLEGFAEAGSALVLDDLVAVAETADQRAAHAGAAAAAGSVFAVDCVPRWGLESICGRRPEMEDAAVVVPRFFDVPLWMVAVDGLDRASFRLPAHFFAVYNGHGGVQVANYCRERIHAVLTEELRRAEEAVSGTDLNGLESKKQWEKAFVDCFGRVQPFQDG
ncbi:hypothetical protein ACP70R_041493 [Stipagrostis hirtigluma subsp. patula]